jgi:hypothetical protein
VQAASSSSAPVPVGGQRPWRGADGRRGPSRLIAPDGQPSLQPTLGQSAMLSLSSMHGHTTKAISGKDSPSSIPSPLMGEGEGGGARGAQGTERCSSPRPPIPTVPRDCVGAARLRASLRPHSGGRQIAISRSKTRPSSLAQCQYGAPVFDAAPSTPCWRGVGMIAARRLLCGAKPPP